MLCTVKSGVGMEWGPSAWVRSMDGADVSRDGGVQSGLGQLVVITVCMSGWMDSQMARYRVGRTLIVRIGLAADSARAWCVVLDAECVDVLAVVAAGSLGG